MIKYFAEQKWGDRPYAVRTWIRGYLPYFLVDLGVAAKADDCADVNASHQWYNQDDMYSACYHCCEVQEGQLWRLDDPDT